MVIVYFMDTSALVKRYINEIGSPWVRSLTDSQPNNKIILARITWVEILSAFARLQRESKIDPAALMLVNQAFKFDWDTQYQIMELDKGLAEKAGGLVQKFPLRAYDSVQLASAVKIHEIFSKTVQGMFTFVSADDRLLNAAKAEGLNAENPNNHQ